MFKVNIISIDNNGRETNKQTKDDDNDEDKRWMNGHWPWHLLAATAVIVVVGI